MADPANPLAADVTWSFTTAAPPPPPPDEGPGGPILVVSSAANPFSRYYVEILRNEGLNAFNAVDISTVDATLLADYDVVILGEVAVDADAGRDVRHLGRRRRQPHRDASRPGPGRPARPDRRRHGPLGRLPPDRHGRRQARCRARRPDDPVPRHGGSVRPGCRQRKPSPRCTRRRPRPRPTRPSPCGASARTAARRPRSPTTSRSRSSTRARATRRGPAQERDGQQPPIIRSDDMFYPDWIDFSKIQIPQADEQQRLLANLIEHVNRDVMPLPRFWYFPRGEKAVVVMTGDDHASGGTAGQFDWANSVSPAGCNVDDWECVRQTSYIYPNTGISDPAAAAYQAQGFEIALHVNTDCSDWTPSSLESFYSSQLSQLAANFPSLSPSATHRTHCITWSDWATQPKVEFDHGIRLDTNYYYWPAAWVQDRPGLLHRIRHADALRRPRRIDDRRLPGGDADDGRERPDVRDEHRHAARQRDRRARLLRRRHHQHAHRQRHACRAADRRERRAGEGRPRRLGAPDADVARRSQRLVVREPDLERRHADVLDRARRRIQRPPGDAPDAGLERLAADADARRQPRRLHHADDQGHPVRHLRRHGRRLRRDVRRRYDPADDQLRPRRAGRRRHRHGHLDDRRARDLPGRLRHLRRFAHPQRGRSRARDLTHAAAHRARPGHDVPLPGVVHGRDRSHRDLAGRSRHLHDTDGGRDRHDRRRLQRGHDRQLDLRVRHRRWRGHPRADGRRRVRGSSLPGGWSTGSWNAGSSNVVARRHLDRRRRVEPRRHARAVRPRDRVRRHLQRCLVPERRVRRRARRLRRVLGDVRYECLRRHAPGPDTRDGRVSRGRRARGAVHRISASVPHRVGYRRPLLHRRNPRPHGGHRRRDDATDRQRLQHRRRRADHRLDAHDAVRVAGNVPVPDPQRRQPGGRLGRPVVRRRRAVGHDARARGPDRRRARSGRHLVRIRADHLGAGRDDRRPLPPVSSHGHLDDRPRHPDARVGDAAVHRDRPTPRPRRSPAGRRPRTRRASRSARMSR